MANEFGDQFITSGELSTDPSPQLSADLDAQGNCINDVGCIEMDITPADTSFVEGKIFYDSTKKVISYWTDDSDIAVHVGEDTFVRVINNSGVTINHGEAVYISGVSGSVPEITKARSDAEATIKEFLGVAASDMLNGEEGHVALTGKIDNFDTSGFTAGDILYISSTVAGELTNVRPDAPAYAVDVGVVLVVDAATGSVLLEPNSLNETSSIVVKTIGTPTHHHLEDFLRMTVSAGVISGGIISDNGDGTVDITQSEYLIRATNADDGLMYIATLAAQTNVAMTDDSANFIGIDYNGGTPQLVVQTTTPTTWGNDIIAVGIVWRSNGSLHISQVSVPTSQTSQKVSKRFVFLNGLSRQTGSVASEVGTRSLAITQGKWWLGLDEYTTNSGGFDSSVADTFSAFYRDGVGGWTEVAAQTQVSNSQYDDGSGTLQNLSSNRYGVYWLYLGLDSDIYLVYGQGDYTASQSDDAQPPASLPLNINPQHGALIAKIIVQQGSTNFTSLATAFEETFQTGAPTDHGELAGLGDDDHTQYLLADGTRAMSGGLDMGGNAISNAIGTVSDETGAAYQLVAGDSNSLVRVDNTLTIPTGLPIGTQCSVFNDSVSTVTLTTTGLTVKGNDAAANISAGGVISLIVTATNTVLIVGEME